jgi:membrane-associated phospholipid phosphatase
VSWGISWFYFLVYIFIFVGTGFINHVLLKKYIHSPRPLDSTPFLAAEHYHKHINGMPSGHAQQTAFSLLFAYLLTGKHLYASWSLFLITILQRYVFKNHTLAQLTVGSMLGVVIGYGTIYFLNTFQPLKEKKQTLNKKLKY